MFSALEHEQVVAGKTTGILKLRNIIPWESFRALLEELTGCATRDWSKGGQPPFEPVLMFKVLVLQKFHGLSDDATEEPIFDRTSFKNFLGMRIGDDIPDANTLRDKDEAIRLTKPGQGGQKPSFSTPNPSPKIPPIQRCPKLNYLTKTFWCQWERMGNRQHLFPSLALAVELANGLIVNKPCSCPSSPTSPATNLPR